LPALIRLCSIVKATSYPASLALREAFHHRWSRFIGRSIQDHTLLHSSYRCRETMNDKNKEYISDSHLSIMIEKSKYIPLLLFHCALNIVASFVWYNIVCLGFWAPVFFMRSILPCGTKFPIMHCISRGEHLYTIMTQSLIKEIFLLLQRLSKPYDFDIIIVTVGI